MLTSYKLNFLIKSISHLQLHNSKNDVKNVPLGVHHWGITLQTHHLYLDPDRIFIILALYTTRIEFNMKQLKCRLYTLIQGVEQKYSRKCLGITTIFIHTTQAPHFQGLKCNRTNKYNHK